MRRIFRRGIARPKKRKFFRKAFRAIALAGLLGATAGCAPPRNAIIIRGRMGKAAAKREQKELIEKLGLERTCMLYERKVKHEILMDELNKESRDIIKTEKESQDIIKMEQELGKSTSLKRKLNVLEEKFELLKRKYLEYQGRFEEKEQKIITNIQEGHYILLYPEEYKKELGKYVKENKREPNENELKSIVKKASYLAWLQARVAAKNEWEEFVQYLIKINKKKAK
ncbi:MAG: hypothetical protein NTZ73_04050 [Candidatus Diapherotrites archaeon]|nr:hypothetical protein [Candidatus Diapherotrites archaeon]